MCQLLLLRSPNSFGKGKKNKTWFTNVVFTGGSKSPFITPKAFPVHFMKLVNIKEREKSHPRKTLAVSLRCECPLWSLFNANLKRAK